MLEIVVCVSGGGTNLQAIIDKIASGEITNTKIVGGDKKVIELFPESIDVETVEEDEVSTLLW